jgi:RNA polymerase sigma factor (TIGR02999 family)
MRKPEYAEPGDEPNAEGLLLVVYQELRRLAASKLAHETGQTLQATALVHEAWLRLGGDAQPAWRNKAVFFSAAAEAMRRVLVDRARRRGARKRGARAEHVPLADLEIAGEVFTDDRILALSDALEKLAVVHPRKAELVKLRYFVGLSFEEVAEALDIAVPTAKEWWAFARAWLRVQIRQATEPATT